MVDSPQTRLSLLVRIRDRQDAQAWNELVEIYAPLVYRLARSHGVQDADAADLTQEVLLTVVRTADRFHYDPARGTFRGWLFTVARNHLKHWAAVQKREMPGSGGDREQRALEEQPAPAEEIDRWDHDYRQRLFEWAAEKVRGEFRPFTWQAFWQTAVDHREVAAVAAELGLSVGAVYIARSRVVARIKEQLEHVPDSL
jgi:RNA polymerase sigma-70 factor (ECF subfamily)